MGKDTLEFVEDREVRDNRIGVSVRTGRQYANMTSLCCQLLLRFSQRSSSCNGIGAAGTEQGLALQNGNAPMRALRDREVQRLHPRKEREECVEIVITLDSNKGALPLFVSALIYREIRPVSGRSRPGHCTIGTVRV